MKTLGYEMGVYGRRLAEPRDAPTAECFGGSQADACFTSA